MDTDTTKSSYWLNWRFLLCAIWVLISMICASILIWKYEGSHKRKENEQEPKASLYKDEAWRSCFKRMHSTWLLGYRVFALFLLLSLLITNVALDGGGIFFFYTQWTFALVTLYFAVASSFSIYGCFQNRNKVTRSRIGSEGLDVERGTYVAPVLNGNTNASHISKNSDILEENDVCEIANFCGYAFQVIFQMSAGAVLLTDSVFWIIIVPFLTTKDYRVNFIDVCLHSLNAVLLLGDTILNCMRFPFFRIAYFVLWTGIFVIFQWIIHACVSMWWPYPFLDLSSPFAPVWYVAVGLMHLPCFGIFALIVRMKHYLFSKSFPDSYQCVR